MTNCRCSNDRAMPRNMALSSPHRREESKYGEFRRFFGYRTSQSPTADDFSISMRESFALATKQVPSIVVRRGLVGGNPCIEGTRIPVYMILDGLEYHGSLKAVLKSYPQLSVDQVKDAVRFSKIVMESYVEP